MIHLCIGTKAQLIKLAPVMLELRRRGIPFRQLDTGQHARTTELLRREFGLPEPDWTLDRRANNVSTVTDAAHWYLRGLRMTLKPWRRLRDEIFPGGGICLIHGDTLSTLLGLQLARTARVDVAHVEAGLSSGRWMNPFPEELIRRYCTSHARLLFACSPEAMRSLAHRRTRGQAIELPGNTGADALRHMLAQLPPPASKPPPYALATCHRFETIRQRSRLERVVRLIARASETMPVHLVLHEPTRRQLERYGLIDALGARVTCTNLLGYRDFVTLLRDASLVLTDGGSIQEECAVLGKPCLILRDVTERGDGIGQGARLWGFDDGMLDEVTEGICRAAVGGSANLTKTEPRPSAELIARLERLRYTESD